MIKKAVIIFSGYNQRAIVSFCRVAEANEVPLIIIAKSKKDTIFNTKYKKYVKCVREKLELDLKYIKNILRKIKAKEQFQEYIVLPSSEALNRFLLKNKDELQKINFTIPLVNEKTYNLISNKYDFTDLCMKNGIRVPKEISINKINKFPVVIKPRNYFTSKHKIIPPDIINSKLELTNFVDKNGIKDFYVQEYIEGESYYLLYYFSKDGTYSSFSQKNILQQSKGKSMIAAIASDIHKKDVSNKFVKLFKKLKFIGLVMVEIKYFNKEYFMIESNPRLWGPSQLFVDSKCNFFELFLNDWGFEIKQREKILFNENTRYFWLGGLIETLQKYGQIVYHVDDKKILKREFASFLSNEIYLRGDTKNIYTNEILNLIGRNVDGNSRT